MIGPACREGGVRAQCRRMEVIGDRRQEEGRKDGSVFPSCCPYGCESCLYMHMYMYCTSVLLIALHCTA